MQTTIWQRAVFGKSRCLTDRQIEITSSNYFRV